MQIKRRKENWAIITGRYRKNFAIKHTR